MDSFVVLMLHANGTNGGTTFTDSSASTHTMVAVGNANTDTATKKFGTASLRLDGSGDYLTTVHSTDFQFPGDFTIDFWYWFNTKSASAAFFDKNNDLEWDLVWSTGNSLQWYVGNSLILGSSWTPSTGQWYHVAIARSGTVLKMFIDGTVIGTNSSDSSSPAGTSTLNIGSIAAGGQQCDGWMDEVRISKGVARWTANFTPPTVEYS